MAKSPKSKSKSVSGKSGKSSKDDQASLDTPTTILRAANGDLIQYDNSGLVMKLSDRVVKDLAKRLPKPKLPAPEPQKPKKEKPPVPVPPPYIDPSVLGAIDAWDVREDGEWYLFHARLPGKQGARQFRRLKQPDNAEILPSINADAGGAVLGYFSLGGSRLATGYDEIPLFPYHVLAPGDDIGAVGVAGEQISAPISHMMTLREVTRDAGLADACLDGLYTDFDPLQLSLVRAEYDGSQSLADLATGLAYANLLVNFQSLVDAAKRLNSAAVLRAITIEFTLEDTISTPCEWQSDMFSLFEKLTDDIARLGLHCPPLMSLYDCGTHTINDSPILRAQWDLSWLGVQHGFYYFAPSYMFKFNEFGRLDQSALSDIADMQRAALLRLEDNKPWACPTLLLAEREPDPKVIRVRCEAMSNLVLDGQNPFGCDTSFGFAFEGATRSVTITKVEIAPDDSKDILITCKSAPMGKNLTLLYGFGQEHDRDAIDYPSACGGLRDSWDMVGRSGALLHRWALPAAIPVH